MKDYKRCNEGHRLFMLWIKAFMTGHPDTKYLREQYDKHIAVCDNCKKADKPR